MQSASLDDTPHENLELRFRLGQPVVKVRYFLLEYPLCLIALLRKRIESVGEPIIEPRQNFNFLGGYSPYECIPCRRWHLFLKSNTRS